LNSGFEIVASIVEFSFYNRIIFPQTPEILIFENRQLDEMNLVLSILIWIIPFGSIGGDKLISDNVNVFSSTIELDNEINIIGIVRIY
jgi:hypothetical protein